MSDHAMFGNMKSDDDVLLSEGPWTAHNPPEHYDLGPPPPKPPTPTRSKRTRDAEEEEEEETDARASPISPSDFFARFVQRTREQCEEEERAPQGSEAWLKSRLHTATASRYGAIAGMSPYRKPEQLAIEMLWPDKDEASNPGRVVMQWGTDNEDNARNSYIDWATRQLYAQYREAGKPVEEAWLRVEERGIIRYPEISWMGVSPDGIVVWRAPDGTVRKRYLEIKCPYYKWRSEEHPYAKHKPLNCPPDYYAQVQGGMGYLRMEDERRKERGEEPEWGIEDCDFVVWQPHRLRIQRIAFDEGFFHGKLFPALQTWYFRTYLPAATAQYNGQLVPGTLRLRRNKDDPPPIWEHRARTKSDATPQTKHE